MTKNQTLISIMLSFMAMTASAADNNALYIASPAAGADTIAYNLSVKPVLKHVGNTLVIEINGKETHTVTLEEGLTMTFGKTILMGDANSDGIVNTEDAFTVTEYFVGKNKKIDKNAADINYDGKVTVADANSIVNIAK